MVGDQVVFKYSSGLHSVVELGSESAYKSCDIGSAVNSTSSGEDVVKLNKPGTRYFPCGTLDHCDQGMKVKITALSGNAPSTPASSSSSPTSTSTSAASDPYGLVSFVLIVASMAASLFFMF